MQHSYEDIATRFLRTLMETAQVIRSNRQFSCAMFLRFRVLEHIFI